VQASRITIIELERCVTSAVLRDGAEAGEWHR
jgi:hypothetical protein